MRDGMQVAQLVGRDPEQHAVRSATGCRRTKLCRRAQCSATVSKTTDDSTASRSCRCGGTATKSPGPRSACDSPTRRRTRPLRQNTDASPGLLCSPNTRPAASAITVCRRCAPDLPYTVTELRPLSAVVATPSWLSASAVIGVTSIDVNAPRPLPSRPGQPQPGSDRSRRGDSAPSSHPCAGNAGPEPAPVCSTASAIRVRSESSSARLAAGNQASSWLARRTPTIAPVTPGNASVHATARRPR